LGPFKYLSFYYEIEEKENPSFYNPPSFLGKKKPKNGVPSIPFISFVIL
jgi:hypothetical protein